MLKQGGGLYARLRIGAVLLAAGEGRRMGGIAKPLIRLQGVPLVKRHLIALSGAGVDEVVVVTGHERAAVEAQVQDFPVTLVYNPDFPEGQQGSVRIGLTALSNTLDAVLVVLCDQPLISAADLTELISSYKKAPQHAGPLIVVPVVHGQRGNPILINREAWLQILSSPTNLACRHLMEKQPDWVYPHITSNLRFLTDLDTPEDMLELADRTGWILELPPQESQP